MRCYNVVHVVCDCEHLAVVDLFLHLYDSNRRRTRKIAEETKPDNKQNVENFIGMLIAHCLLDAAYSLTTCSGQTFLIAKCGKKIRCLLWLRLCFSVFFIIVIECELSVSEVANDLKHQSHSVWNIFPKDIE